MSLAESMETSREIQEKYEDMKKFVGTLFLFFPKRKPVLKEKWK